MEGVKIPKDLLQEFSTGSAENGETGNPDLSRQAALASMEKSLSWLIKVGDDFAKKRDLPGLGSMSNEELAELSVVVAERNLAAQFMEKSPEFLLGSIALGLVSTNMIAWNRQKQKEQKKAEKEESKRAENG